MSQRAHVLLSLIGVLASWPCAFAATPEGVGYTEPAHSLVMPFDLSEGRVSFLYASRVDGRDGTIATHWTYWSDSAELLAEAVVCLAPRKTVVVDPRAVVSVGPSGSPIGAPQSLAGKRGFATATAYDGAAECGAEDGRPLDGVLAGGFTLADIESGSAFGHDALGFGRSPDGSHVDLPIFAFSKLGALERMALQMFTPATLDFSVLILLGLHENAGTDRFPGEIGPLRSVRVKTAAVSQVGSSVPLNDLAFSGATFSGADELIPANASIGGSSLLLLTDMRAAGDLVGGTDRGDDSWVVGLLGQGIGAFGTSTRARYPGEIPDDGFLPIPRTTPTPVLATITPQPNTSPTPSPLAPTPRPGATATPGPTSIGATPTPRPSPRPTPGPTSIVPPPTPGPPPATVTPLPTPTPASTPAPTAAVACPGGRLALDVRLSAAQSVAGASIVLSYAPSAMSIPGGGNAASVLERIAWSGLGPNTLRMANDQGQTMRLAFVATAGAAASQPTARVDFDCAGTSVPATAIPTCSAAAVATDGSSLAASCVVRVGS